MNIAKSSPSRRHFSLHKRRHEFRNQLSPWINAMVWFKVVEPFEIIGVRNFMTMAVMKIVYVKSAFLIFTQMSVVVRILYGIMWGIMTRIMSMYAVPSRVYVRAMAKIAVPKSKIWSNGPNGKNDSGSGDDINNWTTQESQ